MKNFSFTLLLLTALFITTIQVKSMSLLENRALMKMVVDGGVPAGHPDACTREDCAVGTLAFTASATAGAIITFPVCAALGVPMGTAFAITLASGIPGMFLWGCCCRRSAT
jgi:hypothetical protein